jgi:hypothetical protein
MSEIVRTAEKHEERKATEKSNKQFQTQPQLPSGGGRDSEDLFQVSQRALRTNLQFQQKNKLTPPTSLNSSAEYLARQRLLQYAVLCINKV